MGVGSGQLDPPRHPSWLRRPDGILERTRWLMGGLTLVSLLFILLVAVLAGLSENAGRLVPLAVAAAAVLAISNIALYRRRRTGITLDALAAVAVGALAMSCPEPSVAFGYVFAALWFHALYGSTRQSLIRCALFVAALAAVLPLWPLVPGHNQITSIAASSVRSRPCSSPSSSPVSSVRRCWPGNSRCAGMRWSLPSASNCSA